MIRQNFFWILPFIFFSAGYLVTRSFFQVTAITTPSVVGKPLYQALTILSNQQLTIRLLEQKEDADLPEGTVLSQIPSPGQLIKPRQTVFLVISQQISLPRAPLLCGKQYADIERQLHTAKFRMKTYFLESNYPHHRCIAQIPAAGEPVPDSTIIVYITKTDNKPIIWPNFIGKPVTTILEFLEQYQITPRLIEAPGKKSDDIPMVIDQRPLAGSLMVLDPKQLPLVQLFITGPANSAEGI